MKRVLAVLFGMLVAVGCGDSSTPPTSPQANQSTTTSATPDTESPSAKSVATTPSPDTIAWGGHSNGLMAGVEVVGPVQRRFDSGISIVYGQMSFLRIHVRNLGARRIRLYDAGHVFTWQIYFISPGDEDPIRLRTPIRFERANVHLDLDPGQTRVVSQDYIFTAPPPGRYKVRATYQQDVEQPMPQEGPYWVGVVTTGSADVVILAERPESLGQ